MFQAIFVASGELCFSACEMEKVLSGGDIVILRRHSAFRLSCPRGGYKGVSFNVYNDLSPEFSGEPLSGYALPDVREVAGLMLREIDNPSAGTDEILRSLGAAMTQMALRSFSDLVTCTDYAEYAAYWAGRVKQAINSFLFTDNGVRDILSGMGLSYRQLSRYFVEVYGISPKDYQNRKKIKEACRMLDNTNLPVTSIAYELGYSSSQHFATRFKLQTSHAPSKYRDRNDI